MPYDWVHMAKMAKPKKVHPYHIPDRASVYWLDYLIDPRPQEITDPKELREYYDHQVKKFPSASRLSKPRLYPEDTPSRPVTCHGVSTSALLYEPSNRIHALSQVNRPCPPQLTCSDSSNSVTRAYSGFFSGTRPSSGKSDFGKGDYRSRSPQQRQILFPRCTTAASRETALHEPETQRLILPPLKPNRQAIPNRLPTRPVTTRLPQLTPGRFSQQRGQGEGRFQLRPQSRLR